MKHFDNGIHQIHWLHSPQGLYCRVDHKDGSSDFPVVVDGCIRYDRPETMPAYLKKEVYKSFWRMDHPALIPNKSG